MLVRRFTRYMLESFAAGRASEVQTGAVGGWALWRSRKRLYSDNVKEPADQPVALYQDPYMPEKAHCLLCRTKVPISYKNPQLLAQFVSPNTGIMLDRRITGLCQYQHNRVEKAVRISRHLGLMPYLYRAPVYLKDSNLFFDKYLGEVDIGKHIKPKRKDGDIPLEDLAEVQDERTEEEFKETSVS